MPSFIVDLVHPNTRPWSNDNGSFVEYVMDLKGADGVVTTNAKWSRKTDSPAPKAGDSVEGELTPDDRFGGFKFKKAAGGGGYGGGGRGGFGRSVEERRAIAMQASHKVAIDCLLLAAQHGDYKPPSAGDVAGQVKAIAKALYDQIQEVSKA